MKKQSIFEDAIKVRSLDGEFSIMQQMKAAGVNNLNPCVLKYARIGKITEEYLKPLGFEYSEFHSRQTWSAFRRGDTVVKVGYEGRENQQVVVTVKNDESPVTFSFVAGDDEFTPREKIDKGLEGLLSIA
jgi:hypothetical protein